MMAYRVDNRKYAVGDLISKHPESYYAQLSEIYLDNEKLLNTVSNSKVNRKDCVFLFKEKRNAFIYWLECKGMNIYEVEIDDSQIIHVGDMDIVDWLNSIDLDDKEKRVKIAKSYWKESNELFNPEILIQGSIKVLRKYEISDSIYDNILKIIEKIRNKEEVVIDESITNTLNEYDLMFGIKPDGNYGIMYK